MSNTACRKASQRVSLLLAALIAAPLAPALAKEPLALVHSVEIVCHHDQGRAMAAMQEGLAVLPRELSGLMQLVSIEGLWCLRLGDMADEASLRPILAAVQGHYPQAAMVLGQVGRGKVVARVTSRTPAPAGPPVAAPPAPTAAAAPAATPAAAVPAVAAAAAARDSRATSAQAATWPLPPVVLASHTETLTAPVLSAQVRPDTLLAEARTGMEPQAGRTDGRRAQAPAEPVVAATAGNGVWSLWAALAAAAAATTILVSATWLWLGRRSRSQPAAAQPRLRLRAPGAFFATPGLAEDDEQRLQGSLPELALVQANLLDANKDRPVKSIYVTSCYHGEGKTTCAIGLAHGLSRTEAKVLLIDGNPRAAALAGCYHTEPSPGLCECLQGAASPADLPRATKYPNLFLLPFGGRPSGGRPDLLAGNRLEEALARYGEQFDYIIMDGHSVEGADTNVVASLFDGVLIAVQSGRTKWEVLKQASQKMTIVGATMLGVVLNRRRSSSPKLCQSL